MGRRVGCPFPEWDDCAIELPDEWLGIHAERRDEAEKQARDRGLGDTLVQFAIALSLLDDWQNIPGIDGPPPWDFQELPLRVVAWITNTTMIEFYECFEIPKKSSSPSPNG